MKARTFEEAIAEASARSRTPYQPRLWVFRSEFRAKGWLVGTYRPEDWRGFAD